MGKIFIIEVVNVMFHVFGFTVYDNPSVRVCALPLSATFLEKPQLVIRIPIPVINPSPKVETASWEKESYDITQITNGLLDFLNKLRRQPFIGIEGKNPVAFCQTDGVVFLIDISRPSTLIHPIGIFPANIYCLIRTEGVYHDNFIYPLYTFKTITDAGLFIQGDDTGRYGIFLTHILLGASVKDYILFLGLMYGIDMKTPLTQALSHKGRGNFPSLDG